jgi:hypothetical protein
LLLGWSGIAVDCSRGTSKANHQSGDNGCNPTARRLVNREVAAAAAATLRNALAVEKSDFIFLGGVHDSPLEIGISNAVIVNAYVKYNSAISHRSNHWIQTIDPTWAEYFSKARISTVAGSTREAKAVNGLIHLLACRRDRYCMSGISTSYGSSAGRNAGDWSFAHASARLTAIENLRLISGAPY